MANKRAIVEKIISGEEKLGDYDLDSDFDHEEIRTLLEAGVIEVSDLSDWRASDMILDGSLSYDEYPFEKFTHYEQVRQLEQEVISREDFKVHLKTILRSIFPLNCNKKPFCNICERFEAGRKFAVFTVTSTMTFPATQTSCLFYCLSAPKSTSKPPFAVRFERPQKRGFL